MSRKNYGVIDGLVSTRMKVFHLIRKFTRIIYKVLRSTTPIVKSFFDTEGIRLRKGRINFEITVDLDFPIS